VCVYSRWIDEMIPGREPRNASHSGDLAILVLENKRWGYYVSPPLLGLFVYERAQSSDQQAKPVTGRSCFAAHPISEKGHFKGEFFDRRQMRRNLDRLVRSHPSRWRNTCAVILIWTLSPHMPLPRCSYNAQTKSVPSIFPRRLALTITPE
jgi:hypothetical protein